MSIILWTIFLVIAWHWFVGKNDMHSIWGFVLNVKKF